MGKNDVRRHGAPPDRDGCGLITLAIIAMLLGAILYAVLGQKGH